jgi:hypothetical protein
MAKKVKNEYSPEEMYKLKYENKEYYKFLDKLLNHKHFLGGYIFGDNELVYCIENKLEMEGLVPDNEKITDFLYANHEELSILVEKCIGYQISEIQSDIAEEFVGKHISYFQQILEVEEDDQEEE